VQIYSTELERSDDFKGFADFSRTFDLLRGKSEEEIVSAGQFKVCKILFAIPHMTGAYKKNSS